MASASSGWLRWQVFLVIQLMSSRLLFFPTMLLSIRRSSSLSSFSSSLFLHSLLLPPSTSSSSIIAAGRKVRGSKLGTPQGEGAIGNRHVEITGPILDDQIGISASGHSSSDSAHTHNSSKTRSPVRPVEGNGCEKELWKSSPLFTSNDSSDDEDVPEMLKRFSQNGLSSERQLSDTLSSDMIVNSISSGKCSMTTYVCI